MKLMYKISVGFRKLGAVSPYRNGVMKLVALYNHCFSRYDISDFGYGGRGDWDLLQ